MYFVAASLYELDECNEVGDAERAGPVRAALLAFLKGRGLLTPRVRESLARGDAYWSLETRLVDAWREPASRDEAHEASLHDAALRASAAKSFDYEALCLVVLGLTGDESKVALLPFLNACFALVEVEDDLRDYAEDLDRNTFNVYRAFVRRYDDAAPSKLLSWIVTLEATYLQLRTCLSEADLRSHLERNEQQGGAGPAMAPSSGRWVIPPPRREAPALEQAPGEAPPGE